jgi:hypothetical protein
MADSFNLYRSFNPKYTSYLSDGMGRDTYILRHNGGLCNEREPQFQESNRYQSAKPSVNYSAKKDATAIRYCSDGSGRDAYILHNSGGNFPEHPPGMAYKFF